MTNPSVPTIKRADELKPGDWLAAMQIADDGDRPSEVLDTFPYADGDGPAVLLVWRAFDGVPRSIPADAHQPYELAAKADVAEAREEAERAERIADIRAFADWLEDNRSMPVSSVRMQASVNPHGDVWNAGAEGVAEVRRLAELAGAETVQDDDHIKAEKTFGRSEYVLIAWHKDGRPGTTCEELDDEHYETTGWTGGGPGRSGVACACGVQFDGFDTLKEAGDLLRQHIADPTGLLYTRADEDDPTPVSPARGLHVGAVTDGGLVDETERCVASLHIPAPGESCLVCGAEGMRYGEHLEVCASSTDGVVSAQCACGVEVDGFDTFAEARAELAVHIKAATAEPPTEAAPDACTCWATSPNGCPQHFMSESR